MWTFLVKFLRNLILKYIKFLRNKDVDLIHKRNKKKN